MPSRPDAIPAPCVSAGKVDPPVEWASKVDKLGFAIDRPAGLFERSKPMAKHRSHRVEFKRQVAQEFLSGETLHGLAKRHDVSRHLIRIWVVSAARGPLQYGVEFDRRVTVIE